MTSAGGRPVGTPYYLQRQLAPGAARPAKRVSSPGLGPARTEEIENLIKAKDFQGAVDARVGFKFMDYEIDTKFSGAGYFSVSTSLYFQSLMIGGASLAAEVMHVDSTFPPYL